MSDPLISIRDARKDGTAQVRLSDARIIYDGIGERARCVVLCVSDGGGDTPVADELEATIGSHGIRLNVPTWEPLGDYVVRARDMGADLIFSLSEL